jgi:type II secretory pathway component GspD/PulD (secretin)
MKIKNFKIRKIISLLIIWVFIFLALQGLGYSQKILKSLTLQDADIHSVLSFLAEEGKTNIVASPTVTGTVALSLK